MLPFDLLSIYSSSPQSTSPSPSLDVWEDSFALTIVFREGPPPSCILFESTRFQDFLTIACFHLSCRFLRVFPHKEVGSTAFQQGAPSFRHPTFVRPL